VSIGRRNVVFLLSYERQGNVFRKSQCRNPWSYWVVKDNFNDFMTSSNFGFLTESCRPKFQSKTTAELYPRTMGGWF